MTLIAHLAQTRRSRAHLIDASTVDGSLLIKAGPSAARADFTVANRAGKSVWVTTYDGLGTSFWTKCLTNAQEVKFIAAGAFKVGNTGGLIYVRGELKENANCGGKTLSDTGRGGPHMIPSDGLFVTFAVVGGHLRKQV